MADGSVKIDITADDSDVKKKLDGVEDTAQDAADGMDELGDSSKEAGKGLDTVDVAAGNLIANGLSALVGALTDAVGNLLALSDETREFREDMAKLETAFSDAGHSTETASGIYEDFYAILGESDRSVEAVNHLAELTKSEEEVAKWATIAAGVTAKFGDSLPIEGLTEAANETAKVGEVTGPLADALNWAGISEDEFNAKLAECANEQERATLITETLNKQYEAAAAEYNELTASTQDARRAAAEMEQTQADLGAAIEPVTTAWTNLKTQALQAIVPVVEKVVEGFQKVSAWMDENPEKAEIIKGVLLGIAAALGVLAIALGIGTLIQTVTAAFAALNLTMLANPIVLIVAAIAGLVAAFLYLWNNCESFREFFINLWEALKTAASSAAEWISTAFQNAVEWIKNAWGTVREFFAGVWGGITGVFANVGEWFVEKFTAAKNGVHNSWSKTKEFFGNIWTGVKNTYSVVDSWMAQKFGGAWSGVKGIWNAVGDYFRLVWDTIKGIFSVVKSVLTGDFEGAWNGIKGIWNGVSGYFTDIYNKVVGAFDSIGDDFFDVGDDIINGIWKGLKAGWDWLKGKVADIASSLLDAACAVLGINSPSKEFAWAGEMSADGYGVGYEDEMNAVEKDMKSRLSDMVTRVKATVSAENARVGQSVGTPDTGLYDLARAVGTQTAGINSLASEYRRGAANTRPIILQLDKRELGRAVVDVGSTEATRVGLSMGGA